MATISARYIKVLIDKGANASYGGVLSITEFTVKNESNINYALNKICTAVSVYSDTISPASKAVNGENLYTSCYATGTTSGLNPNGAEWWMVDLGQVYTDISKIELSTFYGNGYGSITDYRIAISNDGLAFNIIKSISKPYENGVTRTDVINDFSNVVDNTLTIDKHFSNFPVTGSAAIKYAGYKNVFNNDTTLKKVRFNKLDIAVLNTSDIKIVIFDSALKVKSINDAIFTSNGIDKIATSNLLNIPVNDGDGILLWCTVDIRILAISTNNLILDGFFSDTATIPAIGNTITISNTTFQAGIEITTDSQQVGYGYDIWIGGYTKISKISNDKLDKQITIGTADYGLSRGLCIDLNNNVFESKDYYVFKLTNDISLKYISTSAATSNGRTIVCDLNNNVYSNCFKIVNDVLSPFNTGINGGIGLKYAIDRNNNLCMPGLGGVIQKFLNGVYVKTIKLTNNTDCNLYSVCVDLNNNLWITDFNLNVVYKVVDDVLEKTIKLNYPNIHDICCDFNNNIWITSRSSGTSGAVIKIVDDVVQKTITGLDTPSYICVDKNNAIWFTGSGTVYKIVNDVITKTIYNNHEDTYQISAGMELEILKNKYAVTNKQYPEII